MIRGIQMKKHVRSVTIILVILLLVSISVNVVLALDGTQAEPGSEQDPLVSRSYVDSAAAKNDSLISQLQNAIAELKTQIGQGGGSSEGFTVVEVEAGKVILTGGGTEILLRSGNAKAVAGQYGGLADVTGAKDLAAGAAVAANHLLISSRDDGRGLKASVKCYLLVRGAYKMDTAPADTVTTPTTGDNSGSTTEKTATVNASSLNIRSGPGTTYSVAGSAVKGDKVTVLEQSGDWSKIKNANGVEGWVMRKYLTF